MSWVKLTRVQGNEIIYDSRAQELNEENTDYIARLDKLAKNYPMEQTMKLREAAIRRIERETQDLEIARMK